MRVRASTLRRAGLCVFLGVVTSWLVAWGLVIAAWRGVWELPMEGETAGAALVGPHRIWAMTARAPGCTYELWYAVRVDEPDDGRTTAPGQVPRDEGSLLVIDDWKRHASQFHMEWNAGTAEAFPRSLAARFVGDAWDSEILVHGIGWPLATVRQVTMMEFPVSSGAGPHGTASFEVPWIKGSDPVWNWGGGPVDPIRLPYRPNWPGLAVNTAFYGAVWMLPLFGVPALRRTLRARRGRCTRCNYDLAGTPGGPCPECGTVRDGRGG